MDGRLPSPATRVLVDALLARDGRRARQLARAWIRSRSFEQYASEVLSPALREVGRRWEADEISVVDEHAATAIVEDMLAVLALADVTVPQSGTVAVACAEGEWHSLPARMIAQILRFRGWHASYVGPSLPATTLNRFLTLEPHHAVVVTCTMGASLPGVRRLVDAAHAVGVPVLAGGAGLGPDDTLARTVGADAWARTPAQAALILEGWAERPPVRLHGFAGDQEAYAAVEAVTREAVTATASAWEEVVDVDGDLVARTVSSCAMAGSGAPLGELEEWAVRVTRARGLDPERTVAAFDTTVGAIVDRVPRGPRERLLDVVDRADARNGVATGAERA